MISRLLSAQKDGEGLAVIEGDRELCYLDLLRKAWAILPLLPGGGSGNIAILLPNGGDYISAFWGTLMAGFTAFPINAAMTAYEILPLLRQATADTLITSAAYRHIIDEVSRLGALSLNIILTDELKPASSGPEYAADGDASDETMVLLATSGTTGQSKIVRLSGRNIKASVLGYLDKLRFEGDASRVRYTLAAPFSSAYGIMIICACLTKKFPIVVLEAAITPDALFRAAERHRITHYEGGAQIILLMERLAGRDIPHDLSSLRYFGFGGSKVSGSIIEKVQRAYPDAEFYQGYGMTEASPLIAKHPQGRLEKTHSVGTAIKGLEIAVETQSKIVSLPFTQGEIVIRGPNVMPGYLDNLPETNRVLKNGYLYTGDMGYLDDEGYLYICGRKKNIIIVRGFNVYPEEVEACIQNSGLVRDCVVYGRTDERGNEIVCADIIPAHPQISERQIRLYCSERLTGYKRPAKISLCQSIRKNASGKTNRS